MFDDFLSGTTASALGWEENLSTVTTTHVVADGSNNLGVLSLTGTTGAGTHYGSVYLGCGIQIPASGNRYDIEITARVRRPENDVKSSLTAAAVTDSAGSINFNVPSHPFSSNDIVQVRAASGSANLPTGISASTNYYVRIVDSDNIELSASAGPGAAVAYTDSGTGTFRIYSAYTEVWWGLTQATSASAFPTQGVYFTWLDTAGAAAGNDRLYGAVDGASRSLTQMVNEGESGGNDWMDTRIFIPARNDYVSFEICGTETFAAYGFQIKSLATTNLPTATTLYPVFGFRDIKYTARSTAASFEIDKYSIQFVRSGQGIGTP